MTVKTLRVDSSKPLRLEVRTADPTSPDQGRIWYNSSLGCVKIRVGASNKIVCFTDDVINYLTDAELDYDTNIGGDKPPSDSTRNQIWRGTTAPLVGIAVGDLWFKTDTTPPFEIYEWDGNAWRKSVFSNFGEMFGHVSANQLNVWDWLPIGLTWDDGGSGD